MIGSEFFQFVRLGFGHIVTAGALDHILFLIVLAAVYRPCDWRNALMVVSAFTVGHSLTLLLSVTQPALLPASSLVEFLIPVTIVATGIENILVPESSRRSWGKRVRPFLAGAFGLVHGAGFAGYLRSLFDGPVAVPLAGFNVGIEIGQITVLACATFLFATVDAMLRAVRTQTQAGASTAPRARVVGLSVAVIAFASVWAVQRFPW